jgi:putative tryptophan/tyrosine transport system substrate-binding protein
VKRREFITLLGTAAAAWPLPARAQQPIPRIGMLLASEKNDRDLQARLGGFRQGLERLGWRDGNNIRVDYRFGEGRPSNRSRKSWSLCNLTR